MSSSSSQCWAVITGGGTGIGAAIYRRLLRREPDLRCLAVGRRLPQLEESRRRAISGLSGAEDGDERARVVSADVATPEGVAAVASALPENARVKYLIHNAGLLGPIAPLAEIDRATWRNVVETNLDGPLFLTQALLPHLTRCGAEGRAKARVLHVSSGAAKSAYVGWGPYCATKAGLHMMYRVLSAELSESEEGEGGVLVGSVRPGVVDTPMQDDVRGFEGPEEHFPTSKKFRDLRETGRLEKPEEVAAYFHWLLSAVDDEEFVAEEWDFRDSKEDARWKEFCAS
ncbi:hypothetical protein ACHAWF_001302 [Thalassiosira exigua]